jgi:hypothetical protein
MATEAIAGRETIRMKPFQPFVRTHTFALCVNFITGLRRRLFHLYQGIGTTGSMVVHPRYSDCRLKHMRNRLNYRTEQLAVLTSTAAEQA